MSNLKELVKAKIIGGILRDVDAPGRWRVLIVDSFSLKIVNASCKMADILEEQVTLVEDLSRKRQPYPSQDGIYFISPTQESIQAVITDYMRGNPPYAKAHLYFTSALTDQLFDKIKRSPVFPHLAACKELSFEFLALESQCFSLNDAESIFPCFNSTSELVLNRCVADLSKKLLSVFKLLNEYPTIRYHDNGTASSKACKTMGICLDRLLTEHALQDSSFPEKSSYAPPTLLIMDRGVDMMAPFVHEFTIQAMVYDILDLDNGKYPYSGESGKQLVSLDDDDKVWMQIRHLHIADAMESISAKVNELTNNAAAQFERGSESTLKTDKVAMIQSTLSALPQYQEMKTKYSIYSKLCLDCMNGYNTMSLESLSSLEQEIVTGFKSDGKPATSLFDRVNEILQNDSIL